MKQLIIGAIGLAVVLFGGFYLFWETMPRDVWWGVPVAIIGWLCGIASIVLVIDGLNERL